jgi:lactoylglutathione lyase
MKIEAPNAPLVTVWDHIHLRTPDPETTAQWYEQMLGAEIVHSPGRIDLILGGQKVFITKTPETDYGEPDHPHRGMDHFGLQVKDIDDVAAVLKTKGVTFDKEPFTIRPGQRICFLRGPDNVSIELLERDRKYA